MNEKSELGKKSSKETERLFDDEPTLDESIAIELVGGEDQNEETEAEEPRVINPPENLLVAEEIVDLTSDAAMEQIPDQEPEEPALEASPAHQGVFIPTNRYNLLEFLSSRLITPRAGIGKYYADFFENRSGRIPIVSGHMSGSVAEYVALEDSSAFPVLLELDIESLPEAELPALRTEGSKASRLADLEAAAFALSGVVPTDVITAVHFQSEEDLLEHRARRYENIPDPDCALVVSPHLFGGDDLPAEVLKDWLESIEGRAVPKPADFQTADRVAGALAMIGNALSGHSDELSAFGRLLEGARTTGSDGGWPDWITGGRLSNWSKDRRRKHEADASLFEAACEVNLAVDPRESWRPVEILEAIRTSVLEKSHSEVDGDLLDQNLLPVKEILRNEREARPFEPGRGLASAKALLLFLLRPEPPRVLSWAGSELSPGRPELIAAAALSGLLWGRQMIDVQLREAPIDRYLARKQAHWLSEIAKDFDFLTADPGSPELVVDHTPTESVVSLVVDGESILERRREHSVSEMLLAADLDDPALIAIGRELAEAMSWQESLAVVYELRPEDFTVVNGPEGKTLTIKGASLPKPSLDADAFRRRLKETLLDEDLEARVRRKVAEIVGR